MLCNLFFQTSKKVVPRTYYDDDDCESEPEVPKRPKKTAKRQSANFAAKRKVEHQVTCLLFIII
jgi:hypothetical protein